MDVRKRLSGIIIAICICVLAFSGSLSLEAAEYGGSLRTIKEGTPAVAEGADFTYKVLESGTVCITGYTGAETAFEIPSVLGGYTVSTIGANAFAGKVEIIRVVFPSTITTIEEGAFEGCKGMTTLCLPAKIEILSGKAFKDCDAITEVWIPNTLKNVEGTYAEAIFEDCDQLRTITFEAGLTEIPSMMANNCPSLEYIDIPDSVVKIGNSAFINCDALTNLQLPAELVGIGAYAFGDCDGLREVWIPKSLDYCEIPREEQTGNAIENTLYATIDKHSHGAFADCDNLKKATLEDGIRKVPVYLFEQCRGLEEVAIPDTVSVIEAGAFAQCSNLKQVDLPENLTYVQDCGFLESGLEELLLPDKLQKLDLDAFSHCENLTEITIPKSLVETYTARETYPYISDAFEEKSGPFAGNHLRKVIWEEGSTIVANYILKDCNSVEEVVIPDTVKEIGIAAFNDCHSLKSVELPEGLEVIRDRAFEYALSLEKMEIPDAVTSIGVYCFRDCENLSEVILPQGLSQIPEYCFQYCKNLRTIELPQSLRTIGRWAFDDSGLEEIHFPEQLERIADVAFSDCVSLKKVVIPDSVTEMGSYVFSSCLALEEIILGKGVSTIAQEAFADCISLRKVELPQAVTMVKEKAFMGCTSLTEVIFRGVQIMDAKVFIGCPSLTKMTLPRSVFRVSEDILVDASGVTIYGLAGTYAEDYAQRVGATFADISIHATDVQLNPEDMSMFVGETKSLDLAITPTGCTDEVFWLSSDNNTATVSETGEITAHHVGTVTISVEVGEWKKTCKVTITQPITSLRYENEQLFMKVGQSKGNFLYREPNNATNPNLEFSSQNPNVAIVDENGTIYGIREGHTTITASALDGSGIQAVCQVFIIQSNIEEIFSDIKESDWWHNAVQYVYYNDIMVGTKDKFEPAGKLTREQFVQVLYNNSGKPEVSTDNGFPDVKDTWYKKAVLWANEKNIANGLGTGEFGVGKYIMRQDLALMLYKYATLNGFDLTSMEELIQQYADGDKVSGYAQNAMNWAITQGIMSGKGSKGEDISTFRLDPHGTATRAECASMMMKLLEKNK